MAKSRKEKETTVKVLADNLKKAKMVIFSDLKGLKVKEVTELRRELKGENSECEVAKKTLMNLAFKEAGIPLDAKTLVGDIIGLSFDFGDEMSSVKIIAEFSKSHENLAVLGGIWNKSFISKDEVRILSILPSKAELLFKMLGSIKAPLSGLVNVLSGNLRGLITVLSRLSEASR